MWPSPIAGIEPIQFALAGMNAHINHDLPVAIVSTCTELASSPAAGTVRAENPVHGSDLQGCHPSGLTVRIIGHVPTVRLPPDHAGRRMAAALPT